MAEGLMPQGIQKYLEKRGQTGPENKDRQVAFGRLGWAGEKEYELRFSLPGSEENKSAKDEIARITQGLREAGALEVLDRNVVSLMRNIDPKKATPAEIVDEFATRADAIAGEMRREMKLNGVKGEDVLEAGPWAVLRAGERVAAKLMKLQGDPRADGILGASESLGTDVGVGKGYDVPDWAAVLGGVLVEKAADMIEDVAPKSDMNNQAQEKEFEPSWEGRSWEEIQQESEQVARQPNPDYNKVLSLRKERGEFAEAAERDGVVSLLRDKVTAMMNPTYWIEGDPQNSSDSGVRGKILSYRCDAMETQTIDALTNKGQEATFNVYKGFIESDRQNIARNLRMAYLNAKKARQGDLGWSKPEEEELLRLNGEAVFLGWKEIPPAATAMAVANTEAMIDMVRRGKSAVVVPPVAAAGPHEGLTDPDVMKGIGKRALVRALLRGVWGEGELLQVSQAKSLMDETEKNRIDAQIILLRDLSAADPSQLKTLLENSIPNAGTIVELLSVPGEMEALANACKALGLDLKIKGLEYFDGSGKIDRDVTFGQAFGDDPRIYKFTDGGAPVDYSSWIGKKFNDITKTEGGILEKLALRATALQMGHTDLDKGAEDLRVKEAYAMAQILVKHAHLADFVLTNRDHPWCTEAFPLMHFYEEVLDRAAKSKPLKHGSYMRRYKEEFPDVVVDEKKRKLPDSEMARSLFPPDFLTPYFFERKVMFDQKVTGKRTLYDAIAAGTVPNVGEFRAKEPMKIQTFRNRAAVQIMEWLIEPPAIVPELSVREGNAFADKVAVEVATAANYLSLNEVIAESLTPMPLGLNAQDLIYRLIRVRLAGQIGMALEKDRVALYEDEAFFLGVGLGGATYNFGAMGGNVSMVDGDTISWINKLALPLKGRTDRSTLAQDELVLFESLRGDALAQRCIKAAAQGDWDTALRIRSEIDSRWVWEKTPQRGLMTYGKYKGYREKMFFYRKANFIALAKKMAMNFSRSPSNQRGKTG